MKYRIVEETPGRFKAQTKGWFFWNDEGKYIGTYAGSFFSVTYYDSAQEAEADILTYLHQQCVEQAELVNIKNNYPKIKTQGEVICE